MVDADRDQQENGKYVVEGVEHRLDLFVQFRHDLPGDYCHDRVYAVLASRGHHFLAKAIRDFLSGGIASLRAVPIDFRDSSPVL